MQTLQEMKIPGMRCFGIMMPTEIQFWDDTDSIAYVSALRQRQSVLPLSLSRRKRMVQTLPYMGVFLHDTLKLALHPNKVSIQLASGLEFLGMVQSYLGLLSHGNTRKLRAQAESSIISP